MTYSQDHTVRRSQRQNRGQVTLDTEASGRKPKLANSPILPEQLTSQYKAGGFVLFCFNEPRRTRMLNLSISDPHDKGKAQ